MNSSKIVEIEAKSIHNTVNKTVITDEINIILQDLVFFSPDRPYHFTKNDGLGP
jgi:hypothetical protein